MSRNWIVVVTLVAALVIPIGARAHEGHPHKVMGTGVSVLMVFFFFPPPTRW